MNAADLTHLDGGSVLVKSTADHHDPPVALRGTLYARPDHAGQLGVQIVLEFPEMCNSAAHRGIISLDAAGIERLLASEHDGLYEYTIDLPLDPSPEPSGPAGGIVSKVSDRK